MGHSFGGYSTLSIISQTDRFKAAVVASGFGDTFAEYGSMTKDGAAFGIPIQEQGPGSMGGTPWQVRERYIENSPAFYLDRVSTPVLVIHGEEDRTVPGFLADQVFVDLRRLGKEVELAKYPGEGHAPLVWGYGNQVDFCKRIIDWLDEHLKRDFGETPEHPVSRMLRLYATHRLHKRRLSAPASRQQMDWDP
jgi:dipeptidyl aminopeptidase/acylaminoacyl peptidase